MYKHIGWFRERRLCNANFWRKRISFVFLHTMHAHMMNVPQSKNIKRKSTQQINFELIAMRRSVLRSCCVYARQRKPTTPSLISIIWKWSWTNCRILCLCSLHCASRQADLLHLKAKYIGTYVNFKSHITIVDEENAFIWR